MAVTLIVSVSVLLQLVAALLALRLIRITGKWTVWLLIATAVTLTAVYRCLTMSRFLFDGSIYPPDLTAETIALLRSVALVAGIAWIAPLFQSIRRSEKALSEEVIIRKGAEDRLHHLNAVLSAVRNVNQLITKEKDRQRLTEQACTLLVETRGYSDAWIALFHKEGGVEAWADAHVGEAFSGMVERMKQGNMPMCTRGVLEKSGAILTEAPASSCTDCPLRNRYGDNAALATRLEHAGRVYGLLSVSVPAAFGADEEEQRLFEEVAGDIAFALHKMDVEEDRRRAERELAIRNRIAGTFLTNTDEEMYREVLNVVLEVMNSEYGVFGYLDEKGALVVPSMARHIWDRCQVPDRRIVFPREKWGESIWPRAIRQKKTLYSNEPSTLTPEGHIPITRNISMPMVHQGEAMGLIQVANKETDYTEGDIRLLETIGGYIAPILSARLQRDGARKDLERSAADLARSNRELKESQAQLIQAEKLSALGILTAGIAHELNNPFMAILNFIQYCKKHTPTSEKRHEILGDAETELRRCIGLVQDLLTYSRANGKGAESYQEIEGAEVLDRVLRILSYRIEREGVAVERDIAEDAPKLWVNVNQIQQVFSNVILNALGALALAEREEKRIRLGLRRDGEFVRVFVSDNGVGIPPKNLSKIFDPFFTTKPIGEGTGLGLSVSQNIVKAHGGRIACESEVGKGATFEILLPVAGEKESKSNSISGEE